MENFQLKDNGADICIGGQSFTVFPSRKLIAAISVFTLAVNALNKNHTIKNSVAEADAAAEVIVSALGEAKAQEIFEIGTPNEDMLNLVSAAEYISNIVSAHISDIRNGLKENAVPNIEMSAEKVPYVKRNKR